MQLDTLLFCRVLTLDLGDLSNVGIIKGKIGVGLALADDLFDVAAHRKNRSALENARQLIGGVDLHAKGTVLDRRVSVVKIKRHVKLVTRAVFFFFKPEDLTDKNDVALRLVNGGD